LTAVEQLVLELAPPPEPTLDNFHAGGNAAVLSALRAALAGGEPILYLWGPAGCGKSHLLRALAREAGALHKRASYLCAPGIDLPRDAQFLALDEVQRLEGAEQIAVFDAYNRLRATDSVVLTAGNLPPADLPLRDDLRSRVGSGLVMQVRPLSEDEMRAVLDDHARQRGLGLAPGILDYLLARFPRDLGTLVAAIDALDHYSLRTRRAITLPLLRETIKLQANNS
jgi:DnaA family protein